MGCCSSTPISASLADEIREIQHASYPSYATNDMDITRHGSPFKPIDSIK